LTKTVKAIIHGHFYQPPREDPWTNYIEDQPSASPYKNWNERITKECYGPNAYSRILDSNGHIKEIINNYKYISFNFGPTLLDFLEQEEPEVYKLILEADKFSISEHNGHGNAIAQIYNHVIMPLQSDDDKITQIVWGLADFEKRFGRKSEGIWLSETAVDYKTIDILIDFGIKFIILSPLQAESYRKIGDEEWIKAGETPIKATLPYKVIREKGEITIFFYDKDISTAVSFEHLLHSSDNLANRIIHSQAISKDEDVIVVGTDGEVYGHHEPFGDMCIASLISNYYLKQGRIKLMNFGEYLEYYPPVFEVKISLGDDGRGSSWSCYHGVGRWYKNCGCHTGGKPGWTQKWRGPLRDSFDLLKNEIDTVYYNEVSQYITDPKELRNQYIHYILSNYKDLSFMNEFKKRDFSKDEVIHILKLLEAEKYSMYMYTSCGWFFTELTGIETVQNIKYAYKAIHILGEKGLDIKAKFEKKIEEAVSNIPEFKNGKWILDNWVYPHIQDSKHVANNFITIERMNGKLSTYDFEIKKHFAYKNFSVKEEEKKIFSGQIDIVDLKNGNSKEYYFLLNEDRKLKFEIYISKEKEKLFSEMENIQQNKYISDREISCLSENDLLKEVRNVVFENIYSEKINEIINGNVRIFENLKEFVYSYKKSNADMPAIIKTLLKTSIESYLYKFAKNITNFPTKKEYLELLEIFEIISSFSMVVDVEFLKRTFSKFLYNKLAGFQNPFSGTCNDALTLVEFCNKAGLYLEKSDSENVVYYFLKNEMPKLIEEINIEKKEDEKIKTMYHIRQLIVLAEQFNINAEDEKKLFFKHFEFSDFNPKNI
jgi:hypothetical protein